MTLRLNAARRIRSSREFQHILKNSKKTRSVFLNLWVCPRENESKRMRPPALGMMVSRKTHLRANKRNLWKRRIREAFRIHQREIKNGLYILVQSRLQSEAPDFKTIEKEFLDLLRKTGSLI